MERTKLRNKPERRGGEGCLTLGEELTLMECLDFLAKQVTRAGLARLRIWAAKRSAPEPEMREFIPRELSSLRKPEARDTVDHRDGERIHTLPQTRDELLGVMI